MGAIRGADVSERYEKVDKNVFEMKPIGARPRRKILTNFGKLVLAAYVSVLLLLVVLFLFVYLRK